MGSAIGGNGSSKGSRGLILQFPKKKIRFRRSLVNQFHFLRIGEFSPYHAIDPRSLRNAVKMSLCGLVLPDPEDSTLVRHWHSDDQDPPPESTCRECGRICRTSLQSPEDHAQRRQSANLAK